MTNSFPVEDGAHLRARADALLEIGRYGDAVPLLQSCLTLLPGASPLLCRMAFAFLKLGDLSVAMRYANEAVSADPAEEWGHRLRSAILLEGKEAAQAVGAAETAVALNPNGEQSLHALIKAWLGTKQTERAEEVAAHMRRIAPNSIWTHNGSELAAMHLRQWNRVEYHCRASLALDPQLYPAMNNLGMALCHLGRFQEAVKCFQDAARLMPTDQRIHQRIATARTYLHIQETQGATPPIEPLSTLATSISLNSTDVKAMKRRRKQPPNDSKNV